MSYKIKELNNPSYEFLLQNALIFEIKELDIQMYKNILLIHEDKQLVGLINYCITPSMKGKDKLFIRNIFYTDNKLLNNIIQALCFYCEKKKYSIYTTLTENELKKECIDAFYSNNFLGQNLIYHL